MTLDLTTISVLLGVIGGILGILNQLSTMRKQQDEALRNQATRAKEMDSHNSYAEKFASLTEAIVEMKTDIKWIKEQK